jgi:hypothetical protein
MSIRIALAEQRVFFTTSERQEDDVELGGSGNSTDEDEGSITAADDSGCVSVDGNLICRGVSMIVHGRCCPSNIFHRGTSPHQQIHREAWADSRRGRFASQRKRHSAMDRFKEVFVSERRRGKWGGEKNTFRIPCVL